MMTCTVEGCQRWHNARGLCRAHIQHYQKTGKIETLPCDRTLDERFDLKTTRNGDCLVWTAGTRGDGYGAFSIPLRVPNRPEWLPWRRQVGAHQFALARSLGRWVEHQTLRTCTTKLCVRPDHLYDGIFGDRTDERVEQMAAAGLLYNKSKLTIADVRALRRGADPREVAARCGVQVQTARHARDGINWAWLDVEE